MPSPLSHASNYRLGTLDHTHLATYGNAWQISQRCTKDATKRLGNIGTYNPPWFPLCDLSRLVADFHLQLEFRVSGDIEMAQISEIRSCQIRNTSKSACIYSAHAFHTTFATLANSRPYR